MKGTLNKGEEFQEGVSNGTIRNMKNRTISFEIRKIYIWYGHKGTIPGVVLDVLSSVNDHAFGIQAFLSLSIRQRLIKRVVIATLWEHTMHLQRALQPTSE